MKEKLLVLIKKLEPELQEVVAEVIEKEREYLDFLKPRGVVEEIRDLIDRHAKEDLGLLKQGGKK
jgi:cell division protein FtsB